MENLRSWKFVEFETLWGSELYRVQNSLEMKANGLRVQRELEIETLGSLKFSSPNSVELKTLRRSKLMKQHSRGKGRWKQWGAGNLGSQILSGDQQSAELENW
jgi:hypothetical protein